MRYASGGTVGIGQDDPQNKRYKPRSTTVPEVDVLRARQKLADSITRERHLRMGTLWGQAEGMETPFGRDEQLSLNREAMLKPIYDRAMDSAYVGADNNVHDPVANWLNIPTGQHNLLERWPAAQSVIDYATAPKQEYAMGGAVQPELQQAAKMGIGGDTELAHFSRDELNLFDRINGGTSINPNTGLPQYGWLGNVLKGLVRAGAAIAGGMIAGPLGSAAGSGIATKLTGGSWNDALKGAALSGIGGELTQGISGGGWSPIGSNNAVAGYAPNLTNAAPNSVPLSEIGSMPVSSPSFLQYAKSMPGIAAGLGALSTPLEGVAAGLPSTAGQLQPFSVKPMVRQQIPQGDLTHYGETGGHRWFQTINPPVEYGPPVPGMIDYSGMPGYAAGGITGPTMHAFDSLMAQGRMNARKGGSIHGPGTGTSDDIPAMLSNGEHVLTASEVSALGGGSNEAGHKKIYNMRREILKKSANTNPRQKSANLSIKVGLGR